MNNHPIKSAQTANNHDTGSGGKQPLTAEAKRALAEAKARRQAQEDGNSAPKGDQAKEFGGRKGPDPVRFGDWENGGIVSDF